MKYLLIENLYSNRWSLVGTNAIDSEKEINALADGLRKTNPNGKYQVIQLLEEKNLEVI